MFLPYWSRSSLGVGPQICKSLGFFNLKRWDYKCVFPFVWAGISSLVLFSAACSMMLKPLSAKKYHLEGVYLKCDNFLSNIYHLCDHASFRYERNGPLWTNTYQKFYSIVVFINVPSRCTGQKISWTLNKYLKAIDYNCNFVTISLDKISRHSFLELLSFRPLNQKFKLYRYNFNPFIKSSWSSWLWYITAVGKFLEWQV